MLENATYKLSRWSRLSGATTALAPKRRREQFRALIRSRFTKNVAIVMSGSAAAQVLGFLLTPIISRFYSPTDFGIYGSFNAVANIVGAAAALQYTQAIVLPKSNDDALGLLIVSSGSACVFALLCMAFATILPGPINGIMTTSGAWAVILLALSTVISGFNQSCQAWCVRAKEFKHTSASQVVRSLTSNIAQIGLAFFRAGAPGLILSSIVADVIATLNLARIVRRSLWKLQYKVRWSNLKRLAKGYSDFPKYATAQEIISALSLGLPVLMLTHFFGIAVGGAYAFGLRILTTPMNFLLNALRQVLLQKAAETYNEGRTLMPLYLKTTVGLFAIAALPSLLLFMWAPHLFSIIFGHRWLMAGEFAGSLIIWMLFFFCNLPAVLFARVIRIQGKMLAFNLLLLAARALSLFLGGTYLSPTNTVLVVSLVGALMNVVFVIIVGYILSRREARGPLTLQDCDLSR